MPSFFGELRRRQIVNVAVAYAIVESVQGLTP